MNAGKAEKLTTVSLSPIAAARVAAGLSSKQFAALFGISVRSHSISSRSAS